MFNFSFLIVIILSAYLSLSHRRVINLRTYNLARGARVYKMMILDNFQYILVLYGYIGIMRDLKMGRFLYTDIGGVKW